MSMTILSLIILFVLCTTAIGVACYSYGYNNGLTAKKTLLNEFKESVKTNIKAEAFTNDVLFGSGAEDDNLEPDDFEAQRKISEVNAINECRGFW